MTGSLEISPKRGTSICYGNTNKSRDLFLTRGSSNQLYQRARPVLIDFPHDFLGPSEPHLDPFRRFSALSQHGTVSFGSNQTGLYRHVSIAMEHQMT
jgi:hypothetical protein